MFMNILLPKMGGSPDRNGPEEDSFSQPSFCSLGLNKAKENWEITKERT